jgi:hypothetical protein
VCKRRDQGAADPAAGLAAADDEPRQRRFHAPQIVELRPDVGQLLPGQHTGLGTVRPVVQRQQRPDLVQGEAEALGGFHQPHARHVRRAIPAGRAVRPAGRGQQPLPLIEPDRLDVHAGRLGERADRQARGLGLHDT